MYTYLLCSEVTGESTYLQTPSLPLLSLFQDLGFESFCDVSFGEKGRCGWQRLDRLKERLVLITAGWARQISLPMLLSDS